ncbi:MAG TPA: EamA family transporter [Candidatus Baltobacteraceae bacterium]|nr:EamA family transporter [Candidatus Baltobacteraceae bacterium]
MQPPDKARNIALIALVALAFIWGYNWVVMKVAVHDASPFEFAAWRTFGGGCALAAGALFARKSFRAPHLGTYVWIGIFQTAVFVGLVTWAVVSAGAGQVAMLSYTMPLWVSLLAWPFLGERLRAPQAVAIAIAFAGVACMIGPLNHGWLPSLLALIAGVSWAVGVVLTKHVAQRERVDLYMLTMWQMLAGGVALVVVALVVPGRPTVWSSSYTLAIVYNIFFATALAYFLWTFILDKLPARTASMGLLTNPVVGAVAAWVQLGEVPTRLEAVGMVLVVAGLLALSIADRKSL